MRYSQNYKEKQGIEPCPIKSVSFQQRERKQYIPIRRPFKIPKIRYTIDEDSRHERQNKINGHIDFRVKEEEIREGPAVGEYQISKPIVKPTYDTYQKPNNVVLVKINHIGGTSSFCSDEERFDRGQGQSIYQFKPTPGPGTYNTLSHTRNKLEERLKKKQYNQSYGTINQMIKQSRDRVESIPSYCIPSAVAVKYNGMPKHLQDMYRELNRKKEVSSSRPHSLPLEYWKEAKKNQGMLPIKTERMVSVEDVRELELSGLGEEDRGKGEPKLTETMYKLQELKRLQKERGEKIKKILDGGNKMRHSFNTIAEKKKQRSLFVKNQNMVNMLFENRKYSENRGGRNSQM